MDYPLLGNGSSLFCYLKGKTYSRPSDTYRCELDSTNQAIEMLKGYRVLATSAVIVALAGCAGSGQGLDSNGQPISPGGGGNVPLTATWSSIQANVFTPICTHCHSGAGAPQGLMLDAAHSYSLLVGVPSTEQPSVLRVKAGDPNNSYIVLKLEGAPGISGARMPLEGPYLPQSTIDVIRQWITEGAQNDPAAASAAQAHFAVKATSPESQSVVTTASANIVVGFNHEVDASLLNDTTVVLEKSAEPNSVQADPMESAVREALTGSALPRIPVSLAVAAGNPKALVITPRSPLTAGSYRVTLRGTGAAALADVNAQALGTDFSLEFAVDPAQ